MSSTIHLLSWTLFRHYYERLRSAVRDLGRTTTPDFIASPLHRLVLPFRRTRPEQGCHDPPYGEKEKVPATKNREAGILPRFGGWHHFSQQINELQPVAGSVVPAVVPARGRRGLSRRGMASHLSRTLRRGPLENSTWRSRTALRGWLPCHPRPSPPCRRYSAAHLNGRKTADKPWGLRCGVRFIAAARWEARIGNRFIYEACSRLTVITSSAASGSIADSGTVTVAIESPNALNTSSTQPRSPPAGCST